MEMLFQNVQLQQVGQQIIFSFFFLHCRTSQLDCSWGFSFEPLCLIFLLSMSILLCYEIFQQAHLTNWKRIYHEAIFLLTKPTLYSAHQKLYNHLNFIYQTLTRVTDVLVQGFQRINDREYCRENVATNEREIYLIFMAWQLARAWDWCWKRVTPDAWELYCTHSKTVQCINWWSE